MRERIANWLGLSVTYDLIDYLYGQVVDLELQVMQQGIRMVLLEDQVRALEDTPKAPKDTRQGVYSV